MIRKLAILFILSSILVYFSNLFAQESWRERAREGWQSKKQIRKGAPLNSGLFGSGDYEFSIQHGGLERKYYIHVPPSYKSTLPTALILNFHGGSGSPQGHRKITQMDNTSDKEGFIIAYPRGTRPDADTKKILQRFWNPGKGPAGYFNVKISHIDDIGFVDKMLDDIESKFNIDKMRIYATGFSNGAGLTYALACNLSNRIAAIAPVGCPFWNFPESCNPQRPVSIIYFHGTSDKCAPYNGGPSGCEAGIASSGRVFISAQDTINIWKEKNGCSGSQEITYQRGEVTCKTYKQCNQGAEITFCEIKDGGHTWPGGLPYKLPGSDVGKTTYDISADDAMWAFFKRHTLEN
ncbi:MAG: hypothetical protein PHT41_02855 [Candidatus Omnitrophica bacterium]|nr:hypothetical protein [Candidatus Omnitrophota bacterium]MDD5237393.1 hypothetical protein [Candidatus Omnitrophota bacterium]